MQNAGVTYADTSVLVCNDAVAVEEINRCKFISGSNLCINLSRAERTFPFFNPPGARGEDTFLSTQLSDRQVLQVPCYTFHDGFSAYKHLLDGVLPLHLEAISVKDRTAVTRFLNACIGWIRYKPLYVYITQPEEYDRVIEQMKSTLVVVLPKICNYFNRDDFMQISDELDKYSRNMKKHFNQFTQTRAAWEKAVSK